MTQVTFLLLNSDDQDKAAIACEQAALFYRQQKRVFMLAENLEQAHQLDEVLWSFEPQSFVPHNLVGEGPQQGSPVEIGCQPPTNFRQVLINLSSQTINHQSHYSNIIDFVPVDDDEKQQARARYRHYQSMGMIVNTENVTDSTETE